MRRILVTGANKGIGRATVRAILDGQSDTFVFLGSRDAARGDRARAEIVTENGTWADRITVVAVDVTSDESVAAAARNVGAVCGEERLYGLVNNAGIGLGSATLRDTLEVNTIGMRRVTEAFLPHLATGSRVVNVTSAAGPNFVSRCSPERQRFFTDPKIEWADIRAVMDECLEIAAGDGDFESRGLGNGDAYGLSKACANAYTLLVAREHPELVVNACTPGFIETDLTRPFAESQGKDPAELGMKPPSEGTRAAMHLLFGDVDTSGRYYGSDAARSPLDRYRSPGSPPYEGD